MELRTALGTAFDLELPATATFDFPTIEGLARFIAQQQQEALDLLPAPPAPAPAPEPAQAATAPAVAAARVDPAAVAQKIGAVVRRMLGVAVDEQQPLMEAGLDSLGEAAPQSCLAA